MNRRAEGMARLIKAMTPTLLGLFGVLLLALPIRLGEGLIPTPILPLLVVFYWSIYGPDYLPSGGIFLIGLLQDLLTGTPLGLWPAVYLVAQYIALSQRPYFVGREQLVVWIGFAFVAGVASLMLWLVMSLMSGVLLPPWSLAAQMFATVLVYPLFGAGFAHLHRRVIVEV